VGGCRRIGYGNHVPRDVSGGPVDHYAVANLALAPVTTAGQRRRRLADQAHARDHQSGDECGPTRDENDKFAHRHPPKSSAG
jgi:hypothetical protein